MAADLPAGGPYVHLYQFEDEDGQIDISGIINNVYVNRRMTFVSHSIDATRLGTKAHLFIFHRSQYLEDYHESLARAQFEKDCAVLCAGCRHKLTRQANVRPSLYIHLYDNGIYMQECLATPIIAEWERLHKKEPVDVR